MINDVIDLSLSYVHDSLVVLGRGTVFCHDVEVVGASLSLWQEWSNFTKLEREDTAVLAYENDLYKRCESEHDVGGVSVCVSVCVCMCVCVCVCMYTNRMSPRSRAGWGHGSRQWSRGSTL